MKPSVEQLENLLAEKRHETPGEGYWQDFLCEYHQNRRERAWQKSGATAWITRLVEGMKEMGASKWAYGTGLAYAAIMIGFLLAPRGADVEKDSSTPVKYEVLSTPALEQLEELDLSPSNPGKSGEQTF